MYKHFSNNAKAFFHKSAVRIRLPLQTEDDTMIDGPIEKTALLDTRAQVMTAIGIVFCAVGYAVVLAFQIYHYWW